MLSAVPGEPVSPLSPLSPWSPLSPLSPVSPLPPVSPVSPLSPVSPFSPIVPVSPISPGGPGGPISSVASTFPQPTSTTSSRNRPIAVLLGEVEPPRGIDVRRLRLFFGIFLDELAQAVLDSLEPLAQARGFSLHFVIIELG